MFSCMLLYGAMMVEGLTVNVLVESTHDAVEPLGPGHLLLVSVGDNNWGCSTGRVTSARTGLPVVGFEVFRTAIMPFTFSSL